MRKIIETGHDEYIDEDRIAAYISTGAGNTHLPEVHLHLVDPEDGTEIRAWFLKDELLAALLDPHPEPALLGRARSDA